VSNAGGYATSSTANITVAVVAPPSITSAASASGSVGAAFAYTITGTGLPTVYGTTSLPAGLILNSSTGAISGIPTAAGAYTCQISASNAFGTTTAALSITIAPTTSYYAYEQLNQSSPFYSQSSPFTKPTGLAVDTNGNVYVVDQGSNTVRTGSGSVIAGTLGPVGNPVIGSSDGSGGAASFYKPSGIAVGAGGTLYVTDTGNDTIRMITATGLVRTLAGSAQQVGSIDGIGNLARFNGPAGIAVDSSGNIYVADSGNQTIRKITAAGVVSTLAGSPGQSGSIDGSGAAARFNNPVAVAVDGPGNVYVADLGNYTVRKISPAGAVTTLAGNAGQSGQADGMGSAATFLSPTGIVTDSSGDVFVCDTGSNVIREILPSGYVVSLSGWLGAYGAPGIFPSQIPSRFNVPAITAPTGLAIDPQGDLYWLNQTPLSTTPAQTLNIYEAIPYTPVSISSGPRSATLLVGTSTLFAVAATGQPLSYAWFGPTVSSLGSQVLLSTAASLNLQATVNVDPAGYNYYSNAGNYTVYIFNSGSEATTSFTIGITPGPPQIVGMLASQTVAAGQTLSFSVAASPPNSIFLYNLLSSTKYSWSFNGTVIPGATNSTYTITNAQTVNSGNYVASVTMTFYPPSSGYALAPITATSNVDVVTVVSAAAPAITVQPSSSSVAAGATTTFAVTATGSPAPTYQWYLNGSPITGATIASYTITNAAPANAGTYTVTVTNSSGSVTSNPATLSVTVAGGGNPSSPAGVAPTILTQPIGATIAYGATTTLSVVASATPAPSYQWQLNGINIPGATSTLYSASVPGSYTVVVTNAAGSVTSSPVTVSATTRLINISSRAQVGTGSNIMIAGFVVSGPAGLTEPVLIRGVGPGLSQYGVTGLLAQPVLTLYDASGNLLASNTGWSNNPNATQIAAAFTSTGAFALSPGSADSALLANLPPGAYTAEVTGVSGTTGVALAEIYEVGSGSPELINISTRAFIPSGTGVEIAGIVVTGSQPAKVLVRAVGPALTQFGLTGVLAAPSLTVVNSTGITVASNTGWSNNANSATIAAETAAVGAFPLPSGSPDCAVLLTLPPGAYTAVVNGVGNTGGIALVEAYQAP